VRLRIDGRHAFVNRLGRLSVPVVVAKVDASPPRFDIQDI